MQMKMQISNRTLWLISGVGFFSMVAIQYEYPEVAIFGGMSMLALAVYTFQRWCPTTAEGKAQRAKEDARKTAAEQLKAAIGTDPLESLIKKRVRGEEITTMDMMRMGQQENLIRQYGDKVNRSDPPPGVSKADWDGMGRMERALKCQDAENRGHPSA